MRIVYAIIQFSRFSELLFAFFISYLLSGSNNSSSETFRLIGLNVTVEKSSLKSVAICIFFGKICRLVVLKFLGENAKPFPVFYQYKYYFFASRCRNDSQLKKSGHI